MSLDKNPTRRKLYYVPGLISAIFIPFLFFTKLKIPKTFTAANYSVLSERKEKHNSFMYQMTGEYFMNKIKRKKLIPFYLDENHELNKIKFKFIQREALRLKYTCDTNNVIAIHFSDSLQYGEFVYLLNMMIVDNHKRYAEWKNIFYIFGEEPPDPKREIKEFYL